MPETIERDSNYPTEFAAWLRGYIDEIIDTTVPKMEEYGTRDLEDIGSSMVEIGQVTDSEVSNYEYGVLFYLLGKVARWKAAATRGKPVSTDTLHDTVVYTLMVMFDRERNGVEA